MKVKFVPQDVEYEIKPGQSVMHLAQDHGIYVKSVCKGVPSCAECRVRVVEGDHNVLPPGAEELALIGTGHFIDRRRLSCQLKCFGDITVDMSEQIAKEQGLIGGRKSKTKAVKDDRIEDAYAIRASASGQSPSKREDRREPRAASQEAGSGEGGQKRNRRKRRRGNSSQGGSDSSSKT
jgi:ferredoxin